MATGNKDFGEHVLDVLEEHRLLELRPMFADIIDGTTAVDETAAAVLAAKVGSTPGFWLRLQSLYKEQEHGR